MPLTPNFACWVNIGNNVTTKLIFLLSHFPILVLPECASFPTAEAWIIFTILPFTFQREPVATKWFWVSLLRPFGSRLCVCQPGPCLFPTCLSAGFSFLLLEIHTIKELGNFVKNSFVFWSLQKHTKFLKREFLVLFSALLYQIRDIWTPLKTLAALPPNEAVSSTECDYPPKVQFTPDLWTFHLFFFPHFLLIPLSKCSSLKLFNPILIYSHSAFITLIKIWKSCLVN